MSEIDYVALAQTPVKKLNELTDDKLNDLIKLRKVNQGCALREVQAARHRYWLACNKYNESKKEQSRRLREKENESI